LIVDHTRKTLSVNHGARTILVPLSFPAFGVHFETVKPILSHLWSTYNFQDKMLPNDLRIRGIDPTELPFNDYARDAKELWDLIESFTSDIIRAVYADDAAVAHDTYLQNWAADVARNIGGFARSITTLPALISHMTMIQWMPSVQHSAVNYLQRYWTGYTPMAPPKLWSKHHWPKTSTDMTEEKLLDTMPTKFHEALTRQIVDTLSQPTDEPIISHFGLFAEKHGFAYIANRVKALRTDLTRLQQTMESRVNAHDPLAYKVLYPNRVANSILI